MTWKHWGGHEGGGGEEPQGNHDTSALFSLWPLIRKHEKKEKQDVSKNVKLARGTKLKS